MTRLSYYRIYGHVVKSDIQLSHFPECISIVDFDFEICFGKIIFEDLDYIQLNLFLQVSENKIFLDHPILGKVLIIGIRKIIIEPKAIHTPAELNYILINNILPLFFSQFNIVISGQALHLERELLYIASSNAAISSIVSYAAYKLGARVNSEEFSIIENVDQEQDFSGRAGFWLWGNTLRRNNLNPAGYSSIRRNNQIQKYYVPVEERHIDPVKSQLERKMFFIIEDRTLKRLNIDRIHSMCKIKYLKPSLYNWDLSENRLGKEPLFRLLAEICNSRDFYKIEVPDIGSFEEEIVSQVLSQHGSRKI